MSQIITNPASMLEFARSLNDVCQKLKAEEAALFRDLAQLGKTWQDPKFRNFSRKIDEASRSLAAFHKSADQYRDYLQRKANAGTRLLRG